MLISKHQDHGVTRIGFALPEERWGAGEKITLEDCIFEAKEALVRTRISNRPFVVHFLWLDTACNSSLGTGEM